MLQACSADDTITNMNLYFLAQEHVCVLTDQRISVLPHSLRGIEEYGTKIGKIAQVMLGIIHVLQLKTL